MAENKHLISDGCRLFSFMREQLESSVTLPPLVLKIDLLPKCLWYKGLKHKLSSDVWDVIRRKVYASNNHKCLICNGDGVLHAHEVFKCDFDSKICKLDKIIPVCDHCHAVIHYRRTQVVAKEKVIDGLDEETDELDELGAAEHFYTVNGLQDLPYEKAQDMLSLHLLNAKEEVLLKNRVEWVIDWNNLKNYLRR